MHAPKGFGKSYFSLAAIQAYASEIRLIQNITRIARICPIHPIHTYSTISPPLNLLNTPLMTIFQGHLCANTPSHFSPVRHWSPL